MVNPSAEAQGGGGDFLPELAQLDDASLGRIPGDDRGVDAPIEIPTTQPG
jgi:hypothetical protein